jgi:N-methylhydantoinase B
MAVLPVAGSERFESIDKRPDELVISPKLPLYAAAPDTEVDPVTYEVISHKLTQLNDELSATIKKVSGSLVVTEAYDFNVALGDEVGDLFTVGSYISVHATTLQQMIRWTLENRSDNPGIEEGDMFLLNDPWVGSAHQNDISLLVPIFVDGKLFCWAANVLHAIDVGGRNPGSFVTDAEDVFSEGVPTPPIKLVRGGELQRDVEEMFVRRSRLPRHLSLDMRALIAANNVGIARIQDLAATYGADIVHTVMKRMLDMAESQVRARLRRLPDGTWKHVQLYEVSQDGDRAVHKIVMSMTKADDRLSFDLSESDPQAGYFNTTRPVSQAGVMTAVLPLLCPDLPWAPGALLRVMDFTFKPGTIPAATYPAAVSGGTTTAGWASVTAANVLIGKMLSAGPEDLKRNLFGVSTGSWLVQILGGIGKDGNPTIVVSLDAASGGIGARSWRDGDDTGGMTVSPGCQIANVESQEYHDPVLFLYRREAIDTGGPGRYRGGVAAQSGVIPHGTPAPLGAVCSGFGIAFPCGHGIGGGMPAKSGYYKVARDTDVHEWFADGRVPADEDELAGTIEWPHPKVAQLPVGLDDVFCTSWFGGGGYGDPLDRDPEAVAHDVEEGYVSAAAARATYGVVLGDDEATVRLRAELRGARLGGDPLDAPPLPTLPDGAVWLDEHLVVRADGTTACGRCEHELAGPGAGYKSGAVALEGTLMAADRVWVDPGHYVDDEVVLRQFVCPGCATLLDNEVTLASLPPVEDKLLAPSLAAARA